MDRICTMKDHSLNIFGKTWQIKHVSDFDNFPYHGLCVWDKYEIHIRKDLKDEAYWSCYFHEVFHAIWHTTGLNQTDIDRNIQEVIVENFSAWLAENFDFK